MESDYIFIHFFRIKSSIFERIIVIELVKKFTNIGVIPPLFYWRDKTGHEIDVVVDYQGKLTPIEIRSGKTTNTNFLNS